MEKLQGKPGFSKYGLHVYILNDVLRGSNLQVVECDDMISKVAPR